MSIFTDEIATLRSLVDQTASELSQRRQLPPTPLPLMPPSNNTTFSNNTTSTNTLSLTNNSLLELRRDLEARCQRTRELVTFLEGDIRASKILTENTSDSLARTSSKLQRNNERIRTIEARQQEIWNTIQERPTRSEVHSTITATVLPTTSYSKTRLDALSKSVSALEASFDAQHTSSNNQSNSDSNSSNSNGNGNENASMQYIEQRLERRMEDFIERKMRLRSRQLEMDVVNAVKKSMIETDHNNKTSEKISTTTTATTEAMATEAATMEDQENENSGGVSGNQDKEDILLKPTLVTSNDLEMVQKKFSKEVRLVQNSLVSLRTQLRMLGRDVKAIKKESNSI